MLIHPILCPNQRRQTGSTSDILALNLPFLLLLAVLYYLYYL